MSEAGKLVLVAADVPYSRTLLSKSIQRLGPRVVSAGSLREALDAVNEQHFDCVIADMVNPEASAEQFVLRLRVAGQTMPVVLLCPTVDRDLLRRLSNLRPVGFLGKPLKLEMLGDLLPTALAGGQDLLRRSAELNLTATRQSGRGSGAATVAVAASEAPVDVDRLVRMFGELPLLPHVLTAILRLTDKEPSDSLALAEAISSDPRLSSQLLRVVNSAYYGFARRISTIPEATVVLGSEAIRKLAVGAAACGFFSGHSTVLDRGKLWQHALAVASASRTVAEYRGLQQAEEAFAAGLLHDFGRLALERHCGPQYGGVVELARHEQIPLLAAEEQRLGLHHGWVSGWLARRWSLPDALTDAMANHHQPEAAVEAARYVTAAVNVGDVLAHLGGHGGIDQVAPTSEPSEYAMALLNLERHDLATLIQRASKAATELSQQLKSVMPEE